MNPATRRPLVAGNWKMHGSRAEAVRLAGELIACGVGSGAAEAVVCPPFVHLTEVRGQLDGSRIGLGAQDVCAEDPGAHTGEVSAGMLTDAGCRYVIVGHSERRAIYGESDGLVSAPYLAGYAALVPNARSMTVAKAGHAPQVEQPEALAAAVLEFLEA